MTTQTQNAGLDYEVGRNLLKPRGTDLTFVHPSYGPNTYANVKEQIEQDNLRTATMAETTSLVHAAFNSDDEYSKGIRALMKDRWLWTFTGILYVPNKGAYVQDAPETRNGMPFMDESDLVKRLEAKDPSVRFIPFGYQTGEISPMELARNEYVQALAGEDGAQKLAEVADKHKRKPCLWSFKSVSQPKTRVSVLLSLWYLGKGFGILGLDRGGKRDGCAFGVQDKTGEASHAEK